MGTLLKNQLFNYDIEDENFLATKRDLKYIHNSLSEMEWEPGIVLDIILDDSHYLFKKGLGNINNPNIWPLGYNDKQANPMDRSYAEVGIALIRLCLSQNKQEKEQVIYAYPIDKEFSSCPLLNELVGVIKYLDQYFYTNKINYKNLANTSADFRFNPSYAEVKQNTGYKTPDGTTTVLLGPESKLDSVTNVKTNPYFRGLLGNYFWFNRKIRNLRRFEGDTVIESRFGQSIRFGSYDSQRKNDIGTNTDYKGDGTINSYNNLPAGGGNPMILIRNRQHLLNNNNLAPNEVNVGGYILEDVNADGTSIHITSGLTQSVFSQTTTKSIFTQGTNFKFPKLTGDQIVMNSDRIIISSKANETMHFSKKRYMIVTDDEYVVDAQNQIVLNTNNKTVINSPAIYLGQYGNTNEPAVLGQTLSDLLFDLCNWILNHTHSHDHIHDPNADPLVTKSPKDFPTNTATLDLMSIRDRLHSIMSRRVFLTGGGYAPGFNGAGTNSIQITKIEGETSPSGIPGGWSGRTRRVDGVLNDNTGAVSSIVSNATSLISNFINANIGVMSDADITSAIESAIDNSIS